jgi:hypothetical protein
MPYLAAKISATSSDLSKQFRKQQILGCSANSDANFRLNKAGYLVKSNANPAARH